MAVAALWWRKVVSDAIDRFRYESFASFTSDGKIIVGTRPGVLQMNGPDGDLLWRKRVWGCRKWFTGADAASDGTVYAFAEDGALYALDTTGSLKWRKLIRPPYYAYGPGDHSCSDCVHGGQPVVINADRIMVVIRAQGCSWCSSWVEGIYDASGEEVCNFNAKAGKWHDGESDPYVSTVQLGPSTLLPNADFSRQWRVADDHVIIHAATAKYLLDVNGGIVERLPTVEDEWQEMPVVAWDNQGNNYVVSGYELWVLNDPEWLYRNPPPDCLLTAMDPNNELLWETTVPAGLCWLKPGQDGWLAAAGPRDLIGLEDGQQSWHCMIDPPGLYFEPELDLAGNLHVVADCSQEGLKLLKYDPSGEILSQRKLPYSAERVRFAFSQDCKLYAISYTGEVSVIETDVAK